MCLVYLYTFIFSIYFSIHIYIHTHTAELAPKAADTNNNLTVNEQHCMYKT